MAGGPLTRTATPASLAYGDRGAGDVIPAGTRSFLLLLEIHSELDLQVGI